MRQICGFHMSPLSRYRLFLALVELNAFSSRRMSDQTLGSFLLPPPFVHFQLKERQDQRRKANE
ncbi:hypothetical protein EGR_10059 [Echinococcus granulosus]|uniref:Uncharacterized protein n=1 Tax=Echinococcus granulosus TaxID=6210 RepID=W6U9D1_ECHGR|nr:hypothetical protein EGR_10059 [Echinococcus granulosus]EUB55092.1 hypothetical protein EGR_10059 [Echinococcus granulosus]